jgi:hypothetical protein
MLTAEREKKTVRVELGENARLALDHEIPKTCASCIHFKVCMIAKAFIPLIGTSFASNKDENEQPPINPLDLAKICSEYVRVGSVITT